MKALEARIYESHHTGWLFPHTLLCGPPDSGKTTLALLLSRGLGVGYQVARAIDLKQPRDIIPYFTNAEARSILLIDEIHRLPRAVEEFLYPAMEDFRIDLTLGEGVDARVINMPLQRFTLIGTTSKPSRIAKGLLSRLTVYNFKPYTEDEFLQLVDIGREGLDQSRELMAENRHQQNDDERQEQNERGENNQRRAKPVKP